MKKSELIKKEYNREKASDDLKERIDTIMKKDSRKTMLKWCTGIAASFVIAGVAAVNISPSLAYALSDVPAVGQIVRVATFGRYTKNDNGYTADVATPEIKGLLDKELEDKLNKEFKDNANAVIAAFESDVEALKKEFGDETVHMGVDMNYLVKTDNADYLALDVYIVNMAGSSSEKHTFYTIDKKSGKLLTLKGMFKKDADYVGVLSKYIKGEMERRNKEEDGMFWTDEDEFAEGFKEIKPDQNFYINSNGNIVICFDKYEVAAGAQGSPEFAIPKETVKNIIKK